MASLWNPRRYRRTRTTVWWCMKRRGQYCWWELRICICVCGVLKRSFIDSQTLRWISFDTSMEARGVSDQWSDTQWVISDHPLWIINQQNWSDFVCAPEHSGMLLGPPAQQPNFGSYCCRSSLSSPSTGLHFECFWELRKLSKSLWFYSLEFSCLISMANRSDERQIPMSTFTENHFETIFQFYLFCNFLWMQMLF